MRCAVIGAGGLGGYFGAKLAAAGHDVTFLARGATLEALRADGIRVIGQEEIHVPGVGATDDSAQVGPVEMVLLGVKTQSLTGALPALGRLVGPDTAVLTMQNGVETPQIVGRAVPPAQVLPCIVKIFTKIERPGVILHMGGPGSVAFAEPDNGDTGRVRALREAFAGAGVPVVTPADIWVELWDKALYVASLGALGSLADVPIGVVRTRLRGELAATIEEAAAVGRAHGVAIGADVAERILAFTDTVPADSTTSMQRDIAAGVPSELDGQIGAIVRLGAQVGVPTPRHELMYAVLGLRSAGREGGDAGRGDAGRGDVADGDAPAPEGPAGD